MFILNLKAPSLKKVIRVLAVASVAAAVVCIIAMVSIHKKYDADTATCDEIGTYSTIAENAAGEQEFLKQFGLNVNADSRTAQSVIIPQDFNDVYEQYNELQKKIGLDLSRFAGKQAQKVTYELDGAKEKFAVLLVYDEKIIGGHLTNGEYGSENKPLA